MSSKKNNSNKIFMELFFISILSAFTGFFIGLLFAPQTGKKFRKILVQKMKDVLDRSKFVLIEARIKAEELLEKTAQIKKQNDNS